MKVEGTLEFKIMSALEVGSTFVAGGELYVKIKEIKVVTIGQVNCFNLETCQPFLIDDDTGVHCVKAKIVVGEE